MLQGHMSCHLLCLIRLALCKPTLIGLPALRIGKPNSLTTFRLMKECVFVVVGTHHLEVTKLATFVTPLFLNVTSFVFNIGWFYYLVSILVGSCTFGLSFVLV